MRDKDMLSDKALGEQPRWQKHALPKLLLGVALTAISTSSYAIQSSVSMEVEVVPNSFEVASEQMAINYTITNNSASGVEDITVRDAIIPGIVCEIGCCHPLILLYVQQFTTPLRPT